MVCLGAHQPWRTRGKKILVWLKKDVKFFFFFGKKILVWLKKKVKFFFLLNEGLWNKWLLDHCGTRSILRSKGNIVSPFKKREIKEAVWCLTKGYNSSFIFFIVKVENPQGLRDFIPISLFNCMYKNITKALEKRLKKFYQL